MGADVSHAWWRSVRALVYVIGSLLALAVLGWLGAEALLWLIEHGVVGPIGWVANLCERAIYWLSVGLLGAAAVGLALPPKRTSTREGENTRRAPTQTGQIDAEFFEPSEEAPCRMMMEQRCDHADATACTNCKGGLICGACHPTQAAEARAARGKA